MSDLTIDQGADFFARFEVRDIAGTLVDLTDYSAKSEIRDSAGGSLIGTFVVATGNANGLLDLNMDDNDTALLTPGNYVYDVFITNLTTDDVQRVIFGSVVVVARITQ